MINKLTLHQMSVCFRVLAALALSVVLVSTGCGGSSSDKEKISSSSSSDKEKISSSEGSSSTESVPYKVGPPPEDPKIGMVISSEYGNDTLSTKRYVRQLQMRIQKLSKDERTPDTLQSIHRELVTRYVASHVVRGKAKSESLSVQELQKKMVAERVGGPTPREIEKYKSAYNKVLDSLAKEATVRVDRGYIEKKRKDYVEKRDSLQRARKRDYLETKKGLPGVYENRNGDIIILRADGSCHMHDIEESEECGYETFNDEGMVGVELNIENRYRRNREYVFKYTENDVLKIRINELYVTEYYKVR